MYLLSNLFCFVLLPFTFPNVFCLVASFLCGLPSGLLASGWLFLLYYTQSRRQWGFTVSPPLQPSSCTSSQMTGSWNTQPRLLSDLATLQPPPPPGIEYSEKNLKRERECQGVGVLVGTFNWIIPSAVITPIALRPPAIMEPCKRNLLVEGLHDTSLASSQQLFVNQRCPLPPHPTHEFV